MDVVVGLGSNLGDREATLRQALGDIAQIGRVTHVSSLYETDPVGPPQPAYLNAAARFEAPGTPHALLTALLDIEKRHGRVRRERHGPRILDLDVLWIDGIALTGDDLTVPHSRLAERRFALVPFLDVAPEARHPTTGIRIDGWLSELPAGGILKIAGPGWANLPFPSV